MKKPSDKKDRLERFVRDNREAFDSFGPDEALWERIEEQLGATAPQSTPVKRLGGWGKAYLDWRIAASILLAVGLSYVYYFNSEYGVTRDPKVALVVPAYAREFTSYSLAIDEKRNELLRLTSHNPELYREFSADLDRLEHNYRSLRSELPKAPNQEVLVQAMIQNLQLQLELLNQQLTILQRIKEANQRHENTSRTII
jgi:hypothetical protein